MTREERIARVKEVISKTLCTICGYSHAGKCGVIVTGCNELPLYVDEILKGLDKEGVILKVNEMNYYVEYESLLEHYDAGLNPDSTEPTFKE